MESESSTTPLTAEPLKSSSFIEFSSDTGSELNFDFIPSIATDGDCSESASSLLSSSEPPFSVEKGDTADDSVKDDRTLRGLLLKARDSLLRLRDSHNPSNGAVSDLRAALDLVDTWLTEADSNPDLKSCQSGEVDRCSSPESYQIRSWTPDTTTQSTVSDLSHELRSENVSSTVSSLRSPSSLFPNDLLDRLSRCLLRNPIGDGPRGERRRASKTLSQPQRPSAGRQSSLTRCLLALPTSSAISDRLLRGRGLLKSRSATSTPTENYFSFKQQTRKQQQQQQQLLQRRQVKLRKPKAPVLQRTLFSSVASPTAEQNSLTMLCSQLPITASSTTAKSKPRRQSKKRPPTTRVMAVVTRDSAGRAVSSDDWWQAGIFNGSSNASDHALSSCGQCGEQSSGRTVKLKQCKYPQ